MAIGLALFHPLKCAGNAPRISIVVCLSIGVIILLFERNVRVAADNSLLLLIHSDDAGMCKAVNEATMDGLEHGVVSSASIMVVCPGFEDFARYAVANPKFDYGVHLVLTAEMPRFRWGPVLGGEVPSLTQSDGTFWRTAEEVGERAQPDEVRRELRAQIRQALDRGIHISHLDHHMWVMLQRPDLLQVYMDLGKEFELPIRLGRNFEPSLCGALLQNADEYYRLVKQVERQDLLIDHLDVANYNVPPAEKQEYFISAVRDLKPGLSEFVIHCSVNRPGIQLPHAPDRRDADTKVFTSQEMRDEVRRKRIRVLGWRDLVRLRQNKT